MQQFNLNKYLLVQITNYGWQYLEENYSTNYVPYFTEVYQIEYNGEVYYRLQAHQVIEIFGNALWTTSHFPIKSNVLIEDEYLQSITSPQNLFNES